MLIDTRDFQMQAALRPEGEKPTGLVENMQAAFRATAFSDLFVSEFTNLHSAFDGYAAEIEAATGKRLRNPLDVGPAYNQFGVASLSDAARARKEALDEFMAEARSLHVVADTEGGENFRFRTLADIEAAISAEAQARDKTQADVAGRQTTAGAFGQFFGSAGALMMDPPVGGTLAFGAQWAQGILRPLIAETLIAGTVEAAIQPKVQEYRRRLGLEAGFAEGALNVATAAGGAGLFGVTAKLAGIGSRGLLRMSRDLIHARTGAVRDAETILERAAEQEALVPHEDYERFLGDMDRAQGAVREGRPVREDDVAGPAPARTAENEGAAGATAETGGNRSPAKSAVVDEDLATVRAPEAVEGFRAARGNRTSFEQVEETIDRGVVTVGSAVEPSGILPFSEELAILRGKAPAPKLENYPVLMAIKRAGGIRPDAIGADDLRAIGVTSRTLPGLFNKASEFRAVDNLGEVLHDTGLFGTRADGRVSPDDILEAIDEELRGRPLRHADDADTEVQLDILGALDRILTEENISLDLPDAEIVRRMQVAGRGVEEAYYPGGEEFARSVDAATREEHAMAAERALDELDGGEAERDALVSQELQDLIDEDPEALVPVDVAIDPSTGREVPVFVTRQELAEGFQREEAFISEFEACAGL